MSDQGPELRLIDERAVLALPETLGVAEAPRLREVCLEAIQTDLPITVDAAGVQRVHSASIQCLLALVLRAEESGIDTAWSGVPESFLNQVDQLGLRPWLGLDPEEA